MLYLALFLFDGKLLVILLCSLSWSVTSIQTCQLAYFISEDEFTEHGYHLPYLQQVGHRI